MDERTMQLRVGWMVLATLLIGLILVFMFGELPNLFRPKYTIHVWLRQAPCVTNNTPVRKAGILIGRVTKVQLADEIKDELAKTEEAWLALSEQLEVAG